MDMQSASNSFRPLDKPKCGSGEGDDKRSRRALVSTKYTDTLGAAEHLACSKSYLEKLRLVGGGPRYLKIGHAVRYQIDDLDAWAQSRAYKSTSEYAAA